MQNPIFETCEWTQFYSIKGLIDLEKTKKFPESAVYVWGWLYNKDANFLPYYLGKTENLAKRLFQHLVSIRGGAYTIYKMDYLTGGKFSKLSQPGKDLLYMPGLIENLSWFFENREIQDNINNMLKQMQVTWFRSDPNCNKNYEQLVAQRLTKNKIQFSAQVPGSPPEKYNNVNFIGNEIMSNLTNVR